MRKLYLLFIKPFLDFVVALLVLIIFSPIIILLIIILAWDFKGSPFFFQARNGKGGKSFNVIKFKTMNDKKDDQGNLLPNADRLTSLGRLVRKSSLDELPQLVNVIRGEMSFIGPRPLPVRYFPYFDEIEKKRFLVRPGITGLAQVAGRNQLFWDKRLKLDVQYAENASLLFDLQILLKTVYKVISAKENEVNAASKMIDFDKYKKSLVNDSK
ncbi:sugar transferase [Aequorivita sp. H23M31]|uniref:Sugar transferase n=1 Tax=Aequorivita ciconiae TaxID=2494375 RepID=A0A410G1Z2_9FLAO|nr:sugar transferase [Aequorivita sp. H23M31]QAA81284.1 sugar transferase [Aequorivita sp. H23M31]